MVIFYIVAYGLVHKRNVYEDFIKGAKDGFQTVIQIMPTLVGLMVAVGVLFFCKTGRLFNGSPWHDPLRIAASSSLKANSYHLFPVF